MGTVLKEKLRIGIYEGIFEQLLLNPLNYKYNVDWDSEGNVINASFEKVEEEESTSEG